MVQLIHHEDPSHQERTLPRTYISLVEEKGGVGIFLYQIYNSLNFSNTGTFLWGGRDI